MHCISTRLPYRQANAFSGIILDYLDHADSLKPFYANPATLQGIQKSIDARSSFDTPRKTLVKELEKQYSSIPTTDKVKANIQSLLSPTTFTVTTAHQNNIFTGPLYFIYKIVHAIKLAAHLNESLTAYHFVPVYYIGSEDADIDELNHIYLDGEKKVWNTRQTGAVGRMKIDKELIKLISELNGQLGVLPHGNKIIETVRTHYKEGTTIADATVGLVNELFAEYGLVVLQPDNAELKKQMQPLFEDDLLHQTASGIVEKTAGKLDAAGYKVQANPREINLFYLKDNVRERIEMVNGEWGVVSGDIRFNKTELLAELQTHPERFSPNVILRGLYQETILPNIAFIGGGGETAYWLQLKDLFQHYKIPYPVLVLRNSFLVIEKKWQEKIAKLGFTNEDLFLTERELLNRLVARETDKKLQLNGTFSKTEQLYDAIKEQAASIDVTLAKHVDALKLKTVQRLQELEKKMLRAEKRKFAAQQHQIQVIKEKLFPKNGLQERVDNLLPYYAKWGADFISGLYQHSLSLEQEFVVLQEK
jgi:bacillithiol biosynthesis cysteine-adding enzyme BshC